MGYEDSPQCEMLASRCAFCARQLVDAQSVEVGIGPICRNKYMVADEVTEQARVEGNKLIHTIAVHQKGPEVVEAIKQLVALGFKQVVERIEKRTKPKKKKMAKPIEISYEGDRVFVDCGRIHSEFFDELLTAWRNIPGRRWHSDSKQNSFPVAQRETVFIVLKRFFAGREATGPKGAFTIPAIEQA